LTGSIPALFAAAYLAACSGGDATAPGGNDNQNPTLSITLSATTLTVAQGASGSATVTATRGGGFSGAVTIAVSGMPNGVNATPAPSTIAAGSTTSTVDIGVGSAVAAGSYTLTVRASGTGVSDATATLALTVTATTQGDYTLFISPATLSLPQGQQGTATVNIARTGGFTGSVGLTVNGAPAGMTASLNPTNTTTNSSTLSVAVGASVAAGDYTLTVNGSATGIAAKSATLSVSVTGSSSGGSLTWQFCLASGIPVWFAVRDGNGPWTAVTGTNGAFSFDINGATGGVAYVIPGSGSSSLNVFYATRQELGTSLSFQMCNGSDVGKTVMGSFANVGLTDLASVTLGNVSQSLSPGAGGAFTLNGVTDGTVDLVAGLATQTFGGAGVSVSMSKGIIRRNLNPPAGAVLPVLDFNSAEAFAPVQNTVTINGLGNDFAFLNNTFITANGTAGLLYTETAPLGGTSRSFWGIPAAQRANGDLHMLSVTAVEGTGATLTGMRGIITMFADPADRTVTIGPALGAANVTIGATSPYPSARVQQTAHVHRGSGSGHIPDHGHGRVCGRVGHVRRNAAGLQRRDRLEQHMGAGDREPVELDFVGQRLVAFGRRRILAVR
jgi:hypothetical protein